MTQIDLLIKALKAMLKKHGKTYADVAKNIGLSEASVKRIFANQNLSLQRLEQICQILEIEITDLLREIQLMTHRVSQLTHQQESEIVADLKLLLVTTCVINNWSIAEILEHYLISEIECTQKLLQLDRLKLIELLPKNRYKLLVETNFSWLPNGPIQKFFKKHLQHDFFASNFDKNNELFTFQFGMLTDKSNAEFQKSLSKLAEEFLQKCNEDISEPLHQRTGSALVLALRPWFPTIFNELRK